MKLNVKLYRLSPLSVHVNAFLEKNKIKKTMKGRKGRE